MAIKEIPININTYYKFFIENNKLKLNNALVLKKELEEDINIKHDNILSWKDVYKTQFNIDLDSYDEFVNNKYSNGKFLKTANGMFINKQNDYELVYDLFILYELANKQKELYDCENNIELYKKCIKVNFKEYKDILRLYYTEVHKRLIIEGQGYTFQNDIGWVCINRCTFDRKKKILNYKATKEREKELKESGKRIYNKEEAEWCARNGLEYKAEDKRVFTCSEYCYQIPLIDCKLPKGGQYKFEVSDYRHKSLRGKTNEELIKLCNGNINKICELKIDLKTKLTLCDKADKLLYTKFIRNENQKPFTFAKVDRKN